MVSKRLPVTAVIPTLTNTSGLQIITQQLLDAGVAVVVVDNRPNKEKRAWAETLELTYLPQNKNLGFAGAVNLGAKQAKTEWLLVANDDVEMVTSDKKQGTSKSSHNTVVENLISLGKNKNLVAVSPILKSAAGEIENIGYRVLPIGKVELNFDLEKNASEDLDGLTAAFLLIKKSVFDEAGGFDESFFAYLEDVDLFLTLKEKAYSFGVDVDTEVIHQQLSTSSSMPAMKEKRDLMNWWKIAEKHRQIRIDLDFVVERLRNLSGVVKAL